MTPEASEALAERLRALGWTCVAPEIKDKPPSDGTHEIIMAAIASFLFAVAVTMFVEDCGMRVAPTVLIAWAFMAVAAALWRVSWLP